MKKLIVAFVMAAVSAPVAFAYTLPDEVEVAFNAGAAAPENCRGQIVPELTRLLAKLGVRTTVREGAAETELVIAAKGVKPHPLAPGRLPEFDGYVVETEKNGVTLAAQTDKGLLNAVYQLAEDLGYFFVEPGEKGELLVPNRTLADGRRAFEPRFEHHGVFREVGSDSPDYPTADWFHYYAKLRYNACAIKFEARALAKKWGIRLEVGGHGLSRLLPRELFKEHPEYFRMFQPEDFRGRRMNDANFCTCSPEAMTIVKDNFKVWLEKEKGVYGIHAWADDLPAGGWCQCAACRSMVPSDQALNAQKALAAAIRETKSDIRIPLLAYHDTMFPGSVVKPEPESYLLFAARERCFGHALGDPACPRNRRYLESLKAWTDYYKDNTDAHVYEYYFDQILFRGLHPYLPRQILGDMETYAAHGIRTLFGLQVGGASTAPEWNMIAFSRAAWDRTATPETINAYLAAKLARKPAQRAAWKRHFDLLAATSADALRTCEHPYDIYLDYRWLPESTKPFGAEMAAAYLRAAKAMTSAAESLASLGAEGPLASIADREAKRCRFEGAEFVVMNHQQLAINASARYLSERRGEDRAEAIAEYGRGIEAFKTAKELALASGMPPCWYYGCVNKWISEEFARKRDLYSRMK